MHTEEHTAMLIEIATLLDVELEEVKKFVELMIDGYNFEDGVNGCHLTSGECKLVLDEIQKRKPDAILKLNFLIDLSCTRVVPLDEVSTLTLSPAL